MKNTRIITGLILALTFFFLNNAQKQLSEKMDPIVHKGTSIAQLAYHLFEEGEDQPCNAGPAKQLPKVTFVVLQMLVK